MQATDLTEFNKAVTMAQAGFKKEAYAILTHLARYQSDSSNLFLWIAFTSPDLNEARHMINQAGSIDPANPAIENARQWLAGEEARQPVAKVATATAVAPEAFPTPNFGSWPATELPPMGDIPGVPPQPTIPVVEEKPKKSFKEGNGPFILIGVACVVVLAAAIYMILFMFTDDQIGSQGLPVYPSATRVDLGSQRDTVNKLFEGISFGLMKDIKFELYTVKGSEKNAAVKYYDTELKKQGWTVAPNSSATKVSDGLSYVKDKKIFVVGAANSAEGISSGFSLTGANINIKPGDAVIMVMTAEINTDLSMFK